MWIYEAITLCGSTSVFIGEAFSSSRVSFSFFFFFYFVKQNLNSGGETGYGGNL